MKFSRSLSVLALCLAYSSLSHAAPVKEDKDSLYKPGGKGWGELDIDTMSHPERAATLKAQRSANLTYQGGPVMVAPTNIYYIWYGSWMPLPRTRSTTWARISVVRLTSTSTPPTTTPATRTW